VKVQFKRNVRFVEGFGELNMEIEGFGKRLRGKNWKAVEGRGCSGKRTERRREKVGRIWESKREKVDLQGV